MVDPDRDRTPADVRPAPGRGQTLGGQRLPLLAALVLVAWTHLPAGATDLPTGFEEQPVVAGLAEPVSFRFLPGSRILVAEQNTKNVRLVVDEILVPEPVLTVPNVNTSGGERGLLAIAVDPEWPERNFLYAYYTHNDGQTGDDRLTRFAASGDLDGTGDGRISFDPASALHLLTDIPDIASNHNGGDLRFGIDGMLYVSIGDDEQRRCQAQNLTSLLGKVLRLKVDALPAGATGTVARGDLDPGDNPYPGQGDAAALVWAYGLRNPYRMHVDPSGGGIFVADVGKDSFEEVSHVDAPGPNLGWPHREADAVYNVGTQLCPEPPDFSYQSPIHAYSHQGHSSLSVISIGVYRTPPGEAERWPAEYEGDYFYTDFYEGWVTRLSGGGQAWSVAPSVPGQPQAQYWATNLAANPADFQWGPDGALYYLSRGTGAVLRISYPDGIAREATSVGSLKARF